MTTLNEIITNGFQEYNVHDSNFDEYVFGMVKVQVSAGVVINIFVTDVKINCARNIGELMYICKRVNNHA